MVACCRDFLCIFEIATGTCYFFATSSTASWLCDNCFFEVMSESRNLSDFFLVAICVCTESFFQTCLFTGSWFLYLPVTECMNMLWLFWFFRFVRSVWNRWVLISRVLWFTWLTWFVRFVLRFYNWFCCAAVSGNCFSICNPNSFFREFVYDFLVANGYQNVFLYDMVFGICDGVSEVL